MTTLPQKKLQGILAPKLDVPHEASKYSALYLSSNGRKQPLVPTIFLACSFKLI
jgi:hypothetical protein